MALSSYILKMRCLIVVAIFALSAANAQQQQQSSPTDNLAVFVFGDSLVDVGNNNYLPFGFAKAKSLPNGIDFPVPNGRTPTGRFTNGLNIPDLLVRKAGVDVFIPPYFAPTSHGQAIMRGVNYASGGGGILNETGRIFIQRISLDDQISYFENSKFEYRQMLGEEQAAELVSNAVFSITVGANDFINNYVSPFKDTTDFLIPLDQFTSKLINRFRSQLERLYSLGARRFIIVNVPQIGCVPYQRSIQFGKNGACNEKANVAASAFNAALKQLLDELNSNLGGAIFLYADAYNAQVHVVANYQQYGFERVDIPCCGRLGSNNGIINCRSFVTPCPDRSKYFYWDPYHPTQAGYETLANEFFDGKDYIFPMNVKQLLGV